VKVPHVPPRLPIGDDGARNYAGGSDGRIVVARSARNQASRASSVAFALVIFSCSSSRLLVPTLRTPASSLLPQRSRVVGAMWVENFSGAGRRLVTHLGVIKSAPASPSRRTPPHSRVPARCTRVVTGTCCKNSRFDPRYRVIS